MTTETPRRRPAPSITGLTRPAAERLARHRVLLARRLLDGRGDARLLSLVGLADARRDPAAGDAASWHAPAAHLDVAVAADVLARLWASLDEPVVVVWTRPGAPELTDRDACWLAATHLAASSLQWATPPLLCVGPTGWYAPDDGVARRWRRAPTPPAAARR